jgi:hypothetical protein
LRYVFGKKSITKITRDANLAAAKDKEVLLSGWKIIDFEKASKVTQYNISGIARTCIIPESTYSPHNSVTSLFLGNKQHSEFENKDKILKDLDELTLHFRDSKLDLESMLGSKISEEYGMTHRHRRQTSIESYLSDTSLTKKHQSKHSHSSSLSFYLQSSNPIDYKENTDHNLSTVNEHSNIAFHSTNSATRRLLSPTQSSILVVITLELSFEEFVSNFEFAESFVQQIANCLYLDRSCVAIEKAKAESDPETNESLTRVCISIVGSGIFGPEYAGLEAAAYAEEIISLIHNTDSDFDEKERTMLWSGGATSKICKSFRAEILIGIVFF